MCTTRSSCTSEKRSTRRTYIYLRVSGIGHRTPSIQTYMHGTTLQVSVQKSKTHRTYDTYLFLCMPYQYLSVAYRSTLFLSDNPPAIISERIWSVRIYVSPAFFGLFSTNEKTRSTSPRQSARWPVYNSYTRYTLKNIILLYVGRRDKHKNLH